jgi:predicted metalloprotease with PDZ domain
MLIVIYSAPIVLASDSPVRPSYRVDYEFELLPEQDKARVRITIEHGKYLREISFNNTANAFSSIRANGKLMLEKGRVQWLLPSTGKAWMSYDVQLTHQRAPKEYDALITDKWAIFRGDDLVPPVKTREINQATTNAYLTFKLPAGWRSVETGWQRQKNTTFRIDNPERLFDRPTGWMIAGDLGTRRVALDSTEITISAPKGSGVRRLDMAAWLYFIWPEMHKVFTKTPKKLLIVSAGDPMWRGGLSGPNSLFVHADRPFISENGTSPLLHELVHSVSRISGVVSADANDDWIAEGLAEYYSIELIYRAGGISATRRKQIFSALKKASKHITYLGNGESIARTTDSAVVLFNNLDKELRATTPYTIDDITHTLISIRKVSLYDLRKTAEKLLGKKSRVLSAVPLQ